MSLFKREDHEHLETRDLIFLLIEQQFFIIQKLDQMQVDVQALVTNEATLSGLVGQVVSTLQGYQQQLQNGIDNEDQAAIQGVNTKLTNDIATLQTAFASINSTPTSAPAASGDATDMAPAQ